MPSSLQEEEEGEEEEEEEEVAESRSRRKAEVIEEDDDMEFEDDDDDLAEDQFKCSTVVAEGLPKGAGIPTEVSLQCCPPLPAPKLSVAHGSVYIGTSTLTACKQQDRHSTNPSRNKFRCDTGVNTNDACCAASRYIVEQLGCKSYTAARYHVLHPNAVPVPSHVPQTEKSLCHYVALWIQHSREGRFVFAAASMTLVLSAHTLSGVSTCVGAQK